MRTSTSTKEYDHWQTPKSGVLKQYQAQKVPQLGLKSTSSRQVYNLSHQNKKINQENPEKNNKNVSNKTF